MRGCSYLAGFLYAETPNHLPGARSLGVSAADFSDQPDLLGGIQKSLLFLGMGVGGETGKETKITMDDLFRVATCNEVG